MTDWWTTLLAADPEPIADTVPLQPAQKPPVQTTFGKSSKDYGLKLHLPAGPTQPPVRGPTKPGNNTGNEGPGTVGNRRSATRRRMAITRPAEQKKLQRCRAEQLRFATFNLGQSGTGWTDPVNPNGHRLHEIMTALEKINFDVLGLSETHAKKEHSVRWTEGRLNGAEVFSSASSRGQNDSSIGGVGFIVHKRRSESIVAVDVSSSRVAVLKLKVPGQQSPLKVVQVYAPHSGYSDDEREEFYAELEQKLEGPSCRTVVMGDFNAKIGRATAGEGYIGRHSAEARNDAGTRMAAFAEVKRLHVMNSYFEKPMSKRWTWQSADGRTRSEVDYVLCDDGLSITNIEVLSRFEARSDHRIVRATVKLDMPRMKKHRALANKGSIPKSINIKTMQEKIEAVQQWYDADQRINERYEALEDQLMEWSEQQKYGGRRIESRGSVQRPEACSKGYSS